MEIGKWADEDCYSEYYYVCEINRKNYTLEDMNVENVQGVALSPRSIHVTWEVSKLNCDVLGYRVKYHRLDWIGGAFIVMVDGGDSYDVTLTGLQSSTWYMIYVAAQLRLGHLDYVPGDPVLTHEVVKPPAPTPLPMKPCGGDFIAKNGTYLHITSPNYPDQYDNNEYCEWRVRALSGNALLVHLRDLSTEYLFDWVDIGEGDVPDDNRVHHISGFLRPWRFWTSSTSEIWVTFSSDASFAFRGFMLDIEELFTEEPTEKPIPTEPVPIDQCGGNVTVAAGEVRDITSPNYPDLYDNDLECLWLINTESGARVNVTFLFFHTEYCHDWLEIGNGFHYQDLTTSALRISGEVNQDPFYAVGDEIWMTFTTDYSITYPGFHVIVSEMDQPDEECGGQVILPRVQGSYEIVHSPNYPNHYGNNELCKWTVSLSEVTARISAESDELCILMNVSSFSLEKNFDWFQLGSGSDELTSSSLLYRLTGYDITGSYSTNMDKIWALFTSDASITSTGFNMTYFVAPACGGHFTATSGNISSPLYPIPYPHGSECVWTIDIEEATSIEIVFHVFGLEAGYDYLHIGEGLVPNQGYTFELTGSELPKDSIVNSGQAWLEFTSDNSGDGIGFYLTYSLYEDHVLEGKECGGELNLKYGGILSIQSPNYPSSYYNNERCEWLVTSESGQPMSVSFRDFETERAHDWLDVGSGSVNNDLSTRVRHLSGDHLPAMFIVNAESLWITFYTDDSIVFRGFLLEIKEYNETDTSEPKPEIPQVTTTTPTPMPELCGGSFEILSGEVYNLTSPNYPADYYNDIICDWVFNVTVGKRIRVDVIDFHTERRYDYLDYGNGDDSSNWRTRMRRTSGLKLSTSFTSETDTIWFRFVTDNTVTERGFFLQLEEHEDCVYDVPISPGSSVIIESPGYTSGGYENNQFCQWLLRSEPGTNIWFNNLDFTTEPWYDWVDIGIGYVSSDWFTRLLHVSGSASTDPTHMYYTSSDVVWVTFTADRTRTRQGFQMEFFSDGCVDTTFNELSGEILSPSYPSVYPHNADCLWFISLNHASVIRLTINEFIVEHGYDKLLIGEGDDPSSEDYQVLTGVIEAGTEYLSQGYKLWLKFETDWSETMKGFNITYEAECPDGYEPAPTGICYKFVNDGASWDDARLDCMTTNNGDLVIVDSDAELDYLRTKMTNTFWIGLSYIEWDYEWLWVDCSRMTSWQLDQWNGDVPTHPVDVGGESCAASNGDWTGYQCSNLHSYVCELNIKNFTGDDLNPINLSGHPLSEYAIYISWHAPEYSCDIRGYNISYHVQYEPETQQADYVEGAMTTEFRIFDLLSDTTYVITVASYTVKGIVQPGSTVLISTLPPKPTQPIEPTPKPCGGEYTVKPGTTLEITSPGYPASYSNNEHCEWVISVSEGKRLKVTIWEFETEYGYDFVDLGNGNDTAELSTRFIRLSGSLDVQAYVSQTEILWMVFESDGLITAPGFLFEFEEIDPVETPTEKPAIPTTMAPIECGENITVFSEPVSVISPNYPEMYYNSLECVWIITAPEGRRILIDIIDFETEAGFDWVTMGIGADPSEKKSTFKLLTGVVYLAPFDANSNQMWMTFTSDHSNVAKGFNITFQDIRSVDCGGSYTIPPDGHVGIFSPNYPAHYDNNEFCEWIITTSSGRSIVTSVRSFWTEDQYDWVDIGSGSDSTNQSSMIKHMSGYENSQQFTTESNEIWVTFISDGSITRFGFSIEFYEDNVCNDEYLTDSNGFISSPNFPMDYPNSIDCVWIIDISSNLSVKIDFINFETEAGFDWLIIGEGYDPYDHEQYRFSGSELPPTIISETSVVWLRFTTDYSITKQGWLLLYDGVFITPEPLTSTAPPTTTSPPMPSTTPCTPCGGELVDFHGTIISCPYPDGSYCEWKIRQAEGEYVYMEIQEFSSHSGFDWMYIGHGANVTTDTTMYYLSAPPSEPPPEEEYTLTSPVGNFSSPNWPEPYENNQQISWTITVEKGLLVRINILQFFTELNHDFLTFGSGETSGTRIISRLSGWLTDTPETRRLAKRDVGISEDDLTFVSEDYAMWLVFNTDESNIDQGFYLEYDSLPSQVVACGESNVTDPEGTITSPNYPDTYPDSQDCIWYIRLPDEYKDHRVEIQFVEVFDLEYREDYLWVGSGDDIDKNIQAAYTGYTLPDVLVSYGSIMWLRFTSDESIPGFGFKLNYRPTVAIPEPVCPTLPSITSIPTTMALEYTYTASIIVYEKTVDTISHITHISLNNFKDSSANSVLNLQFTDSVQDDFSNVLSDVLNDWCPKDPSNCLVDEDVEFGPEHLEYLDLEDTDQGVLMDIRVLHPDVSGEYALTTQQLEEMLTEYEDHIEQEMGIDYEVIDRSNYVGDDDPDVDGWLIFIIALCSALFLFIIILLIIYCRDCSIDSVPSVSCSILEVLGPIPPNFVHG
ncbi:cubilin-like [Saccoglossus kowalevskii]